jgi:hypothetical protein
MDPRTQQHLDRAERNRVFAQQLLSASPPGAPEALGFEWLPVVAFYSAVHYVNAYFWEKLQWDPGGHDPRVRAIAKTPPLLGIAASFDRLSDKGWQARYARRFRLSNAEAQELVNVDLQAGRQAVLKALGVP